MPEISHPSPLSKLYQKLSPKRKPEKKISRDSSSSSRSIDSREIRAVFDYMDENSDGEISPSELQICVSLLGGVLTTEEAKSVVDLADLDGDGYLDLEEFEKLMEGKGCKEEEKKKSEPKESFAMYVVQGTDCITPSSLKMMLSRLGELKSVDDCRRMIRAFDLNGDGVLCFDEFALMMR